MVTGGAGYVGSVVSAALLAAGHHVTVLDDLSTGHRDAVPAGAHFVHASITAAESALAATLLPPTLTLTTALPQTAVGVDVSQTR